MKTIAVIGANGKSGQVFVKAALAAGYAIRAGIHSSNTLPTHKNLTCITINATKQSDMEQLLAGADVVVSVVGHGRTSPDHLQSNTIRATIGAMKKHNLRRIISLTGSGVRFPGDTPSLIDRTLNGLLLHIVMPNVIKDGIEHSKLLQASALDWTIIRGLVLTTGKAQSFSLSEHGPAKLLCPRADVAKAILQVITDDGTIRKALIISNSQ